MILVENPSFGLPSPSFSSSSSSSTPSISTTSSLSSTPASHFHRHHQPSNSSNLETEFAFDLLNNSRNLLLDDIEFLSREPTNSLDNNQGLGTELQEILSENPIDLLNYSGLSEYPELYYNKNKSQPDNGDDLKFLKLDLLTNNSTVSPGGVTSSDPEFFDKSHQTSTNFEININSLTPSVQRLFSSQISMSGFNISHNNSGFSDSSLINQSKRQNLVHPQQQISRQQQSSSSLNPHPRLSHPSRPSHQLIRQDSQILFGGSCCSSTSNTNTSTFDSVSNYGSGGSSSTSSSTPSTPSNQQSNPIGLSLPSFSEIYSPPRFASSNLNQQQELISSITNLEQQQQQTELNFDQFINSTIVADYFKFEDYISESESDLDNNILLPKEKLGSGIGSVSISSSSPPIQIKEESMDTIENDRRFHSPLSNIDNKAIDNSVSTIATTTGCPLQFNPQTLLTSTSSASLTSTSTTMALAADSIMINKMEQMNDNNNDGDDDLDEKIITAATDFLFSSSAVTSTTSSSTVTSMVQSPTAKTMRIHLHNLSLNVLNNPPTSATVCLGPPTSASATYQPFAKVTSDTVSPIESTTIPTSVESTSGSIQLEPSVLLPNSLVYHPPGIVTATTTTNTTSSHRSSTYRNSTNLSTSTTSKINGTGRGQKSKSTTLQTCAVCGDVAACQHYGVLTCEGCKGFFKRTVQKGSKYTCLGNKDCTVDKRRRNRCQFCRFQKCLAVGMVKEVVRTDSLKGRRGRLPSKPKSPHPQDQTAIQSPPMSTIASLLKAHDETSADKANLDFSRFSENIETQVDNKFGQELIDHQVLSLLSSSLDTLWTFVEKIPGFQELNELDKKSLFQNSCLELFALRMAYRITSGTNFIILCNNIVLHRNQFMFTLGEWLPMIEELSNQLHSMNLDVNAFVCLCALTVITARDCIQDSNQIEQIENKIINSLRDHTIYNNEAQKKPNYFSRILTKLSELRTIGEFGHRIIIKKIRQLTSSSNNTKSEILELERKILPINIQQISSTTITNTITTDTDTAATSSCDTSSSQTTTSTNQLEIDFQSIASFFKDWPELVDR